MNSWMPPFSASLSPPIHKHGIDWRVQLFSRVVAEQRYWIMCRLTLAGSVTIWKWWMKVGFSNLLRKESNFSLRDFTPGLIGWCFKRWFAIA